MALVSLYNPCLACATVQLWTRHNNNYVVDVFFLSLYKDVYIWSKLFVSNVTKHCHAAIGYLVTSHAPLPRRNNRRANSSISAANGAHDMAAAKMADGESGRWLVGRSHTVYSVYLNAQSAPPHNYHICNLVTGLVLLSFLYLVCIQTEPAWCEAYTTQIPQPVLEYKV